jgi:hypothetical protein
MASVIGGNVVLLLDASNREMTFCSQLYIPQEMNAISVSKSAQFRKTRRVHLHVCVPYGLKECAM